MRAVKVLFMSCLLTAATLGCDDTGTDPSPIPALRLGAVLGSVDLTLTVFSMDSLEVTRTVGLGPDGSPVGFAERGGLAAVPLGLVPALAVVDLRAATLLRTVALPQGSGATGVDFIDDSVALVANPGLDSVTPVNVVSGTTGADVPVGVFPQWILVVGNRAYVANANLVNFAPAGRGWVTVLDAGSLTVVDSIPLSGTNPGPMAMGPDGHLYVLNSGSFGAGDGSLSVVDVQARTEVAWHDGFGEFPGTMAFGGDGQLYVGSFGYGVAAWDPMTELFSVAPDAAVAPNGVGSVSGLGFDLDGNLWTLEPECGGPGHVFLLDSGFGVVDSVIAGVCPIALRFAELDS